MHLTDSGKLECDVAETLCNAEKYLFQVLNRDNHVIETLDNLGYQTYRQQKSTTILDLPLTRNAAKGHILRAFYAVHIQINCLNN